jgi:hypothetical protein
MKNFLIKILVSLGLISVFKGISGQFESHAGTESNNLSQRVCDTMGGKTGGCHKCNR